MAQNQGIIVKTPRNPGAFIRLCVLEPLGLNFTQAAAKLGMTRAALSNFLGANASLSPEMAIRLNKAFGVDMAVLMKMQGGWDIVQARKRWDEVEIAAAA